MDNQQLCKIFREIASLLDMQGDDPFRIRAYRRASQTLSYLSESLRRVARRGALEEIPGIGKTLAREIQEFLDTGQLRYHEHLKTTVPEGLLPLLHLPSLSAEHVRILWRKHDIVSMRQLVQAFHAERLPLDAPTLVALGGDLAAWERRQHRMLLGVALPRAEILVENFARLALVEHVSMAGSLRRGAAMVSDINMVMASTDPPRLIHLCNQQPEVRQVADTGPTSTVIVTSEGLRVSLTAVLPPQFASALHHFTGSTAHLAALGRLAQQRGWQLTEHGILQLQDGQYLHVTEEADIYQRLGLPYIAPELREDIGEIEAAETNTLPTLVTMADVRGDLHVHSAWGEGTHSLEDVMQAAQRLHYQYVAICDYAHISTTGRGLTPATLARQLAAIRQLNTTLPATFRLLAGVEVGISPEGEIDFDEGLLQELDIVIAAAHTGLKEPRHKLTRRLCKAMEHPLVDVLAHPAGRMLGRQELPAVDMEAVLETAVETATYLEVNSHVLRLDLEDVYIRQARDLGVTLCLGSGAQNVQEMRTMPLGLLTARRGWAEPQHVLNTLPYPQLLQRLHRQDVSNVT